MENFKTTYHIKDGNVVSIDKFDWDAVSASIVEGAKFAMQPILSQNNTTGEISLISDSKGLKFNFDSVPENHKAALRLALGKTYNFYE